MQSTGSAQILPCPALGEHSSLSQRLPWEGCSPVAEKRLQAPGRAQGWQILTLIQLQEKVFGSQGAAMGPGGDGREETTPALLIFTPCFFKEKSIMELHVPPLWISAL